MLLATAVVELYTYMQVISLYKYYHLKLINTKRL